MPRHPPAALSNLTKIFVGSCMSFSAHTATRRPLLPGRRQELYFESTYFVDLYDPLRLFVLVLGALIAYLWCTCHLFEKNRSDRAEALTAREFFSNSCQAHSKLC